MTAVMERYSLFTIENPALSPLCDGNGGSVGSVGTETLMRLEIKVRVIDRRGGEPSVRSAIFPLVSLYHAF